LKGLALLAAIALLGAICVVHAEDAKGPSEVQQDRPLQEQPNTLPPDTNTLPPDTNTLPPDTNTLPPDTMREPGTISTGHDEIDSKFTRPRTQEDVIREILGNQPSDKSGHANPLPPR
jgi:hypothetical protein